MKILVICGAGASSTFVARRLRDAALAGGCDWAVTAGTSTTVVEGAADLVLLGPHLADQLRAISAAAQSPVAVLPADIFADRDGSRTFAIAKAAITRPTTVKGTP